jgi:hypothetical protein
MLLWNESSTKPVGDEEKRLEVMTIDMSWSFARRSIAM